MLTSNFIKGILSKVAEKKGCVTEIINSKLLAGGSINNAAQLFTTSGNYFVKWNNASRFPGMFEVEAEGINLLRSTNVVSLPAVVITGVFERYSFLVLELLLPGKRINNYWEQCGNDLAVLHKNKSENFGLHYNNYIGSLPQSNKQHKSGVEFMIKERYEPLVSMAFNSKLLDKTHLNRFASFYKHLPDLFPQETPSLLHGDLWNGNVIAGNDGKAWLIDPAVYFGYRETDLAMAKLFGGFDDAFFDSYNNIYALEQGWEKRIELFQLYPLLVHLNLFGGGYRNAVLQAINY